ncbi:MAG: acyl-CoA dehydrogenase family protein [Acidimicrobiaceae bacterium]|nr:acyl-CoA dehydrogenase family protein [Acidimicrobiaceae bacterium]
MDFSMSDEQALIVETVRRFVESEIIPLEADLDPDAGELEPDDAARLTQMTRDMGFYGLDIPAEYGGPGLDTTTRALMAIEMSKHRAGLVRLAYRNRAPVHAGETVTCSGTVATSDDAGFSVDLSVSVGDRLVVAPAFAQLDWTSG